MKNLLVLSLIACLSPSLVLAQTADANVTEFCKKSTQWYSRATEAVSNKGFVKLGAAAEKLLHRGCPEIQWMTDARKAICEKSLDLDSVQLPEKFIFLFDGFAGFNPELGAEYGAVNIKGYEENDFGKGYGNGIKAFMKAFSSAYPSQISHQLHYHATSGFQSRENIHSALACGYEMKDYVDMIQELSPRPALPKWIVFGFSNGGDRATVFQNKMAKEKNLAIDLVFTVDSVAQWGSFMFDQLKKTIGEKNPLTKRFVNFYQRVDQNSFILLGLKGKPVRKATHNIYVTPEDLPILGTEKYPHSALMASEFLSEFLTCELRALDFPETVCDYSQFQKSK